jgi:hypothetical protein
MLPGAATSHRFARWLFFAALLTAVLLAGCGDARQDLRL